jgi:hypothetical protein
MRHPSLFSAGLALAILFGGAAQAETCAQKIARLEKKIQRTPADAVPGATLPETTAAKLHHQPTAASVSQAVSQSDADLLDDARLLDAEGKEKECLAKLKPFGRK